MLSYFIAAFGSVILISFYLVNVLKNTKTAVMFGGLLTLLYFTLYIIVSAEDFALLMGSGLVFIVLAVVMMTTRNIDWYQVNTVERQWFSITMIVNFILGNIIY